MTLPTGTVTFLFTDIEGSTKLWEERPETMRSSLTRHDALMRQAIADHNGQVFKTIGDAFCAAFASAPDAACAILACQLALQSEPWPEETPIKVRMALHTGAVESRDNDYFGRTLNRVARLLATAYGGQAVLSEVVQTLCRDALPDGCTLKPLGEHRLKDLAQPETVYQLCHPDLPDEFPPLRSLNNPDLKHNLVQQLTSFVGREKEMDEIKALLEKTRLLTLTGSGGTGKTRLALQVAAEMLDGLADGVWLVELASLSDPALVAQTVAEALGVKEEPGRPILQTLADSLQGKHLLLLLDNCEHLLDACARLADTILRQCPRVQIFASSREGLGIMGETTYRVPSLSLPDPKAPQTPESLAQSESSRLFIERALQVQTGFVVTSQNASVLASLCHRLDGIPFAIELAAARVRSMTVEELGKRLDDRFRLLTGGSRTAVPRQQTLRSLIDWSYDLLNEAEKALLCRLSTFVGGWTLEAAEQVCSGPLVEAWELLDLLTGLVDKSLVSAEARGSVTRYRLLETVRQYARERLQESGEAETWRDRHLAYFLALGEEAQPHLAGGEQQAWLEQLETEHDNLRAALGWSLEEKDEIGRMKDESQSIHPSSFILPPSNEAGLRLCAAVFRFWLIRGHFSEGRMWCGAALESAAGQPASLARGKALNAAAGLAFSQGDYSVARSLSEQNLAIARELGSKTGIAAALHGLGVIALAQGDYEQARSLTEESLAIQRELGNRKAISWLLGNLGSLARSQGDYSAAQSLYEESLSLRRELGDRAGVAACLQGLGNLAYFRDELITARTRFEECLAIQRELGDQKGSADSLTGLGSVMAAQGDFAVALPLLQESLALRKSLGDRLGIAESLGTFASLAAKRSNPRRAACLLGAVERLREEINAPRSPDDKRRTDTWLHTVKAALDENTFLTAYAEGRVLSLEQAISLALSLE